MSVRQTITEYIIYPPGNCKKVAFEKKTYIVPKRNTVTIIYTISGSCKLTDKQIKKLAKPFS